MVAASMLPGRGMGELSARPSRIRPGPPRWTSHRRALFFEASRTIASTCIFIIGARMRLVDANTKQTAIPAPAAVLRFPQPGGNKAEAPRGTDGRDNNGCYASGRRERSRL